ncbi:hypothetical protein [Thermospira aquatica]|uniref:Uncharacterized protein n=1 Tax=Thermospira aquatica TaxID=2828656 RepID=A0AAX3BC08_9SPIR|nr:hypothetical protein [Thermospira aquatica]URA09807.1 hypothetical protein KDW03_10015 [Thermospira aquatica]
MKKKPNLNFDELKNPAHTYHYSRAERMKRNRNSQEQQTTKWYYRLVGNNRTTLQMLIFYVFLAIVFWFFWWAIRSQAEDKRVFRIGNARFVEVRWIANEQKKGWNVLIDNKSKEVWKLKTIELKVASTVLFFTNATIEIAPNDYVAWFFAYDGERPSIPKLEIKVGE